MENEKIKEMTREHIKQSFIDLCEKNVQADITVTEICKAADISRSSFYRFFSDKDDLMKEIEREYMSELKKVCKDFFKVSYNDYVKDRHAYDAPLRKVWEYHFNTRKVCRVLLSNNGDPYFTYTLYSFLESAYKYVLKSGGKSFGQYQNIIIRFQVNGILSLVFDLLRNDEFSPDIYPVLTKLFVNLPLDNFTESGI